jgi:hypothetical protein
VFFEDNKVTIFRNELSDNYYGIYYWFEGQFLLLSLNQQSFKPLNMIFYMTDDANLIFGLWHNISKQRKIVSGTAIIQRAEPSSNSIPIEIKMFFRNYSQNTLSVPRKIFNISELKTWLEKHNEIYKGDDLLSPKFHLFISAPIYSIPKESYLELRTIIMNFINNWKNKGIKRIVYLGRTIDSATYEDNLLNKRGVILALMKSKYHLAILPTLSSPGIFMELGYSIKAGKPILICYANDIQLPKFVLELIESRKYPIQVFAYASFDELQKFLVKFSFEKLIS